MTTHNNRCAQLFISLHTSSQPILVQIEAAIASGTVLNVLYLTGGKGDARYRPIKPIAWLKKPYSLKAVCVNSNDTKTYRTDRILKIDDASKR